MEVTLHREYKTTCLSVFFKFLRTKTLKQMLNPFMMNKQKNKQVFSVFLSLLHTKTWKWMQSTFNGKRKKKEKTCIMNVFQFLRYQNAKTHEQHFVWRYILSVFHIIRCQNVKINTKPLIWGNETILQKRKKKTYLLSIFFVYVRHQNAKKKYGNHPIWK